MNFKYFHYIEAVSNTDMADINEILVGYWALGGSWNKFNGAKEAKKQLELKKDKIGNDNYDIQEERAKVMVKAIFDWAKSNGIQGKVAEAWWTARPGILSKAVGVDVDSRKNPTDTLLKFKFKGGTFLGISAKSTKGKGDIGFKNPGLGTVEKTLNIDLKSIYTKYVDKFVKDHNLSTTTKTRKSEIRADSVLAVKAKEEHTKVMSDIRDALFVAVEKLDDMERIEYIIDNWMDAPDGLIPMYIKVTGHGNKPPFTATISDPLHNEKNANLLKGNVKFEKIAGTSIGVTAGSNKRIMKMRVKSESQAMASNLKFSGDPWK